MIMAIEIATPRPPRAPRGAPLAAVCLGIVLAFMLGASLSGCGAGAVQTAMSAQAEIIRATQPARFEWYGAMHRACIDRTRPDVGAYRQCMLPAEGVARSADAFARTLEGAQATLDAGETGDALGAVACVVDAARAYLAAAEAAGAPVPAEVRQIAAMIPEGLCHAE